MLYHPMLQYGLYLFDQKTIRTVLLLNIITIIITTVFSAAITQTIFLSEIIVVCWFDAQEAFLIIIRTGNSSNRKMQK